MSNENIHIRDEEFQEVIGKIPNILTRYGSLFILIVFLSIIALAAFIKYPEIVNASFEISSVNPPVNLKAKTNGKIEALFKNNNETVQQGDLIMILENEANEDNIHQLEMKIDSLIESNFDKDIQFPAYIDLGRIQSSYALFLSSLEQFQTTKNSELALSTASYLDEQIQQLTSINQGLKNQFLNCQSELQVLQNNYNKDLDLLKKGIISERELNERNNLLLQKKSLCEDINIAIANNQLRIQELGLQRFNVNSTDDISIQNLLSIVKENALKLQSDIDLWKDQFLVIAPIDGQLSYNQIWSSNQLVEINQDLLAIIQVDNEVKIKAWVASNDIAKIKKGHIAHLNLEAFNYLEYGFIQAKVVDISPIPYDNKYQIELNLINGMTSTYGKEIQAIQGMVGNAEIVVDKRSFLAKIFDKFRYLIKRPY